MSAVEHAKKCVKFYRSLGLCPLPSRMDVKGPALESYADHYGSTPVPEHHYEDWRTTNMQLITGTLSPTPTKILVVDCDGADAIETWGKILRHHGHTPEPTWVAESGSGGGVHHYFRIPMCAHSCPSGPIWGVWDTFGPRGKGGWLKHKEIRILADRALVIAPPSLHVESGRPYEFERGRDPRNVRLPAMAPAWLLSMPRLVAPKLHADGPAPAKKSVFRPEKRYGKHYSSAEVLDAVGDKLRVAHDWGLVTTCLPNAAGWAKCYVPGRETPWDSSASGSFSVITGRIQDRLDDSMYTFFDLGVMLGCYSDWMECREALGQQFLGIAK